MSSFAWEPLLDSAAPPGSRLQRALFTTYDRPDDRLFVEHLLPMLLRLNHQCDGETRERQFFFVELDQRLKQLHDRLIVVSSCLREEATPAEADAGAAQLYPWLWRFVRHLTVGSQGAAAVQHAKLWLLHFGPEQPGGPEHLEIVISSANLTLAALKGQIQAGWRVCLPLNPQRSQARLKGWGILPEFLRELLRSASDDAALDPFLELLARADCPGGVTFVASVPGAHSEMVLRSKPWGAAGLTAAAPPGKGIVKAAVLSPYVGSWKGQDLQRWCARFEGSPAALSLVWIGEEHPWARAKRWLLPRSTLRALLESRSSVLHLRREIDQSDACDRFHDEHRPQDERWSHAKAYCLRRGTARRVLVTSANFSPSAWGAAHGAGGLRIRNFELGVVVAQAEWPFEGLEAFEDRDSIATTSEPSEAPLKEGALLWAQARWDGGRVEVACRIGAQGVEPAGEVSAGEVKKDVGAWTRDARDAERWSAQVPWTEREKTPPGNVRLWAGGETLLVPIFDERRQAVRDAEPPPEVDPDAADWLRDQLLFEQYGGAVADDQAAADGEAEAGGEAVAVEEGAVLDEDLDGGSVGWADSYEVSAFVHARRYLEIVDNWASLVARLAEAALAGFEHQVLRRDGDLLREAFRRQAARDEQRAAGLSIAARLASEEMTLRLKHFPEVA